MVKGIGVVSGTLKTGEIKLNDKMLLGPVDGNFIEVQVKSIHNNFREGNFNVDRGSIRMHSDQIFSRKEVINKKKIRKGMVLYQSLNLEREQEYSKFTASITILHHPTTIKQRYEPVIHGKIAQTAVIESIDNEYLRTGDKGIVNFRPKYRPEFIERRYINI